MRAQERSARPPGLPIAVFHLVLAEDWARALRTGRHRPKSLTVEKFIHCSLSRQVARTHLRYFGGRAGVLLLRIPTRSKRLPKLIFEFANGDWFPHLYGALDVASVERVTKLRARATGSRR